MLLSNVSNHFGCANLLSVAPSRKRQCWNKVKIYFSRGGGCYRTFPQTYSKIWAAPWAKMETHSSPPAQPLLSLAGMTFEKWVWRRVAQRFGSTSLLTFTKTLLAVELPSLCMLLLSVYLGCVAKRSRFNLSSASRVEAELCSCTLRTCINQVLELSWQAVTS